VVVIGDSGVGKSNIITRYTSDTFKEKSKSTVGVEFGIKSFSVEGSAVKVTIWDTAGQDRFKVLTKGYYRGSHGAMIVYDITSLSSFEHAAKWLEELVSSVDEEVLVMLVGNKSDLEDQRQVSTEVAREFARENSLSFIETSAKLDGPEGNVEKAFVTIVTEIYRRAQSAPKKGDDEDDGKASVEGVVLVQPPPEKVEDKPCC
jgi:Ras-related protein Rab-11A